MLPFVWLCVFVAMLLGNVRITRKRKVDEKRRMDFSENITVHSFLGSIARRLAGGKGWRRERMLQVRRRRRRSRNRSRLPRRIVLKFEDMLKVYFLNYVHVIFPYVRKMPRVILICQNKAGLYRYRHCIYGAQNDQIRQYIFFLPFFKCFKNP